LDKTDTRLEKLFYRRIDQGNNQYFLIVLDVAAGDQIGCQF